MTIVPLTVSYGMNAIVTGGTQAVNGLAMLNPQRWTGQGGTAEQESTSGAPVVVAKQDAGDDEFDIKSTNGASQIDVSSLPSATNRNDGGTVLSQDHKEAKKGKADEMQTLLSLDTVLEFVHADRESLKRIETFQAFPGTYGVKVREAIEEVLICLLKTVAQRHIVPACNK